MSKRSVSFLFISIFVYPGFLRAQWQFDGSALSTAPNDQAYPVIVTDGVGGAIVAWHDFRDGTDDGIYVQRLDTSGVVQWTADGIALCTAAGFQESPAIVADGAGGAIVTWHDFRSGTGYDIYAQQVNASGLVQWTADGVAVCTAWNDQTYPAIASDGAGGAIVTWSDLRSGTGYDTYAQRVNASGMVQWAVDGLALRTTDKTSAVDLPRIVMDGSGGAIVMWHDYRGDSMWDIYAQRVNASGAAQWTANGVALCTAARDQLYSAIASDGAGGAIATWSDYRSGTNYDIYAQRVNGSGVAQWTEDGVALCTCAYDQYNTAIISDGAGGAIGTWFDERGADIYAQRVNASGVVQWEAGGVAVCTAAYHQTAPTLALDGAGGAIVAWEDGRSGAYNDIYAQRVDASGVPQWAANGVALCTAANSQSSANIVTDLAGGAIVAWHDRRSGTDLDIYAQRVISDGSSPTGVWGADDPQSLLAVENHPNPFSATTMFAITLRHAAVVEIEVFDVMGRRVRSIEASQMEAGTSQVAFDGLAAHGRTLPSGVYFLRVHAGLETVSKKVLIER